MERTGNGSAAVVTEVARGVGVLDGLLEQVVDVDGLLADFEGGADGAQALLEAVEGGVQLDEVLAEGDKVVGDDLAAIGLSGAHLDGIVCKGDGACKRDGGEEGSEDDGELHVAGCDVCMMMCGNECGLLNEIDKERARSSTTPLVRTGSSLDYIS